MNTEVINIRVTRKVKREIQKIADELGLSVSAIVNGYLRHIVKTKTIILTLDKKLMRAYWDVIINEAKKIKDK